LAPVSEEGGLGSEKYSPAPRKAAGKGEALSKMSFFRSLEEGAG